MSLETSAIAAFCDEAVGEIVGLKGTAVRKMRKVIMSELAVSMRPWVGFNSLRRKGEGRGNVAVCKRAVIGTIWRVGSTAPFANAWGFKFPVTPRRSVNHVLLTPVQVVRVVTVNRA